MRFIKDNRQPKRLVCEGPCNGGVVQDFDAVVRAQGIGRVGRDWLLIARSFIHTLHRPDVRDFYVCLTCRTQRRYGKSLHF